MYRVRLLEARTRYINTLAGYVGKYEPKAKFRKALRTGFHCCSWNYSHMWWRMVIRVCVKRTILLARSGFHWPTLAGLLSVMPWKPSLSSFTRYGSTLFDVDLTPAN
ncbi:hypothetical protein GDO78_002415 [Eleutherodactylus coqui]|uniref:Uncharacterized protein n=1 Tax=Eleutherodactylus coqui TaxID=57060 RepID=A0A8J6EWJ4_ELECQ|nr:hypothetical protein GDO78_002415 [Eleutherodactylus coqui]